ncbi:MAG: hypothetical protein A3K30_03885 [Deltaproteobacteria bacterium RBG_13_51_10]|nr:MAG: hypothetical protein A3K30_03885 [Deltaproteobacteria bacterium RBG_13_51_10]
MKFEIRRKCLRIKPESEIDLAYIEDILGLKKEGDSIPLVRVAPYGLPHATAFLQAGKPNKGD